MGNSRKKEEGKGGLRSLEGSRKTGAQFACYRSATIAFELNLRNASGPPTMRIKGSYMENSIKKEEGKGGLRSLEGSRKTGAQSACLLPASHDPFELTYGTPADYLRYAVAQRFGRNRSSKPTSRYYNTSRILKFLRL
jgi:hypothetical protein